MSTVPNSSQLKPGHWILLIETILLVLISLRCYFQEQEQLKNYLGQCVIPIIDHGVLTTYTDRDGKQIRHQIKHAVAYVPVMHENQRYLLYRYSLDTTIGWVAEDRVKLVHPQFCSINKNPRQSSKMFLY